MTPLQAAALAALVAWRKADEALKAAVHPGNWDKCWYARLATEDVLCAAADALIAAEVTA